MDLSGATGANTRDEWYDYDAQNRFTVTQGSLMTAVNGNTASGVVTTTRGASASATNVAIGKGVLGGAGIAFTYDAASQRTSAAYARDTHQENYT